MVGIALKRMQLFLVLIIFSMVPMVQGAVTSVDISPSNPEVGDMIRIEIQAGQGEDVAVSLDYRGDAPVSGGEYSIRLDNVLIPGKPNSFSARVSDVSYLRVGVQYSSLPWITIKKDSNSNGVASISQSGIPTGNYNIKINGEASSGETIVDLSFNADITLTMDGNGEYSYSYDTENIPPGTIDIDVGRVKNTIILRSGSGGSPPVPSAQPPTADFTVNGGYVGEAISFDAGASKAGSGSITEYSWSFGDGETGSGATVTHSYSEPGEYIVELEVKNTYNLVDTVSRTIVVAEEPNMDPVVEGGGERGCLPGQVLEFRSRSSDPDGDIVEYIWGFGDGSTGYGRQVSHSWEAPGRYYVNHTVVDDRGGKVTVYYTVNVMNVESEVVGSREILVEDRFFQYFGDLGASITASGNSSRLYLLRYNSNPFNESLPEGQIGEVLDLVVSDPEAVRWPIYIELDYPQEAVDNVTETSLGLYYYTDGWKRCLRTGVIPVRGVVWANLTRGELSGSPLTVGVVEPLPYFVVQGLELESDIVEEGGQIVASFNMSNTGESSGNLVQLIYLGDNPTASRSTHLEPGESRMVTVSFLAPDRGTYFVNVGDHSVPVIVTPPTVPDLVGTLNVSSTMVTLGESVAIDYMVHNDGNRTASNFTCILEVAGLRVSSTRIPRLEPGESREFSYEWGPRSEGSTIITVTVDTLNNVSELLEDNNVAQVSVETEKPFPWLTVLVAVLVLGGLGWLLRNYWSEVQGFLGESGS